MSDLVTRAALKAQLVSGTKLTQTKLENIVDTMAINSEVPSTTLYDRGCFWFPRQSKSITPSYGVTPTFTRSTTAKYMKLDGTWADAAIDTPAFHHIYNAGIIESAGVLLEPARTNLIIRSGDMTNASWTVNNAALALVTSPDGTSNAVSFTETSDGSATFHRAYIGATLAASSTYSCSVFYKPATNGRTKVRITVSGGPYLADIRYDCNSLIADVTNSPTFTASITPYPNGWYRLVCVGPSVTSGTPLFQFWSVGEDGNPTYQGDGRLAGYFWAPQVELGADASGPIITAASTVTRAAPSLTIDNLVMNNSGMLVVQTIMPASSVSCTLASIDDGTSNNFIKLSRASDGTFNANITGAGTSTFNSTISKVFENNEEVTSGVSFEASNTVAAIKGNAGTVDTAMTLPVNLTRISFDPAINGCVSLVKLFEKQASNTTFVTITGQAGFIGPDSALLNYSDYCIKSTNSSRTELTRPYVSGNYEYSSPGSRLRFNCSYPEIALRFTSTTPEGSSQNGTCTVLVNGTEFKTVPTVSTSGTEFTITIKGAGNRLIEFIWPTSRHLTFLGIYTYGTGAITAPVARPTTKLCCIGDSTTHGFYSSKSTKAWPYLLAGLKNWQIQNMGYGSSVIDASLGTLAANLAPDRCIYLIGWNNFNAQTPLATFKATMSSFVTNFRAILPTTKLYLGGPFWTSYTNTLTPANYRTQVSDLVTALGDSNTIFVNTLAASTNSLTSLPDGVHFNDTGSLEVATYLNGVIS